MRETVLKAADIMEQRGWVNGERLSEDGRVCVLGALELAIDPTHDSFHHPFRRSPLDGSRDAPGWGIVQELAKVLGLDKGVGEHPSHLLANWSNESDGSTVVAALRRVAEQLS